LKGFFFIHYFIDKIKIKNLTENLSDFEKRNILLEQKNENLKVFKKAFNQVAAVQCKVFLY